MKMQDSQLSQAIGDTASTIDHCSSVTGPTATTNGTSSKCTAIQGQRDHLGRACRFTGVELFTPTAMCKLPCTSMIGSSLIHAHQSIYFVIDPSCAA